MKELDLFEKLAHAPIGLKLYSPIYGDVELNKIIEYKDIEVRFSNWEDYSEEEEMEYNGPAKENWFATFHNDGKFKYGDESGECMLFPNKECRDWSKFQIPKVGDLVKLEGDDFTCKVSKLGNNSFKTMRDGKLYCGDVSYLMNFEIIKEPKFKVGDIVIANNNELRKIVDIDNMAYLTHDVINTCGLNPRYYKSDKIRLATKQELRDKYNLMLDENKNLVRWMPKSNEKYYYINSTGEILQVDNTNAPFDIKAFKIKNCFPTEKLARKKLKEVIKMFKE